MPSSVETAPLDRLLAGDEAAFLALVRRHGRSMRALARYHCGNDATADEIVQEAWVAILNGLRSFEGRSQLSTWMMRIVANRARTRAVREKRTVPLSAFADEEGVAPDIDRFAPDGHWARPPQPWGDPERVFGNRELLRRLDRALTGLPERQRAVVTLRDLEGLDPEEVCALLDISEANQRVLLHRGRTSLRDTLDQAITGGKP